jgi:predicted metalloprotease
MRWKNRRQSENIEDRRASGGSRMVVGGGLGMVVLLVIGWLAGVDPLAMLGQVAAEGGMQGGGEPRELSAEELQEGEFISTVLADTEDVWNQLFPQLTGRAYREPTLVLFRDAVQSACGSQSAAVGPFYCPGDSKVYLDMDFFDTMAAELGAPGDFAQAYVLAHEVGHHVQNLIGISDDVRSQQARAGEAKGNELSVRLELQADYLAGVWAHHADRSLGILDRGDVEEALRAASQIGDDTLQRRARGRVMPESFTHGTSEQRVRWFRRGLESGDLRQMDTFSVLPSQL